MRSLAIVQWSRLGDLLQTRPLLNMLNRCDPTARLVLFADARYADVVRLFPETCDFVPVDLTHFTGAARHISSHGDFLRDAISLYGAHNGDDFAESFVLTRSNAAAVFAGLLRPTERHGYRMESGCLHPPEQVKWVEEKMAAGLPAPVHLADLWISLARRPFLPSWLAPLRGCEHDSANRSSRAKRLAILCDAGENYRDLPQEWLAGLVSFILAETETDILLLGQRRPYENGGSFTAQPHCESRIVDARGRTTLTEFCRYIENSALVIGPDTGGLHLAAAFNVPVIGFYFGGAEACRTGPYAKKTRIVRNPTWTKEEIKRTVGLIRLMLDEQDCEECTDGMNVLEPGLDEYGIVFRDCASTEQSSDSSWDRMEFFQRFSKRDDRVLARNPSEVRKSDIAIIIPENGAASYTEELLPDLTVELDKDGEIIIVCSGESASRPRTIKTPSVRYVGNSESLTFAEACNLGASETVRKYLLFLNNDTRVPRETIETLIAHANEQTLLSPLIRYPDGLIQNAGVSLGDDRVAEIAHGAFACDRINEPDALSAVAFLVPRRVFLEMQGFDPAFRNGYEDLDFCLRAVQRGYRLQTVHDASVLHYRGASPGRYEHDDANRRLFVERWYPKLHRNLTFATEKEPYNPDAPFAIVSDEPAIAAGSCLRWIWPLKRNGLCLGRDYNWIHTQAKAANSAEISAGLKHVHSVVVFRPLQSRNLLSTVLNSVADNHAQLAVDADDLFLGRLTGNSKRVETWRSLEDNYFQLLTAADMITVSTPELQENLRTRGFHAEVVETLPGGCQQLRNLRRVLNEDFINIGFFGTPSHLLDLGSILPALEAILENHPQVRFFWWGCRPGELAYHRSVRQGGPYIADYPLHLRRLLEFPLDIAVVPLLDSPFARAKSPVKFFEYALAGIPAVYSDVRPYRIIVEHNRTGILASDHTQAWIDAIEKLIASESLRSYIRQEAYRKVNAIMNDSSRTGIFRDVLARIYAGDLRDSVMMKPEKAF